MKRVGVKVAAGLILAAAAGVVGAVAQSNIVQSNSVDLDQGWSGPSVTRWYGGYQGSRLIKESWLRALEQPNGTGKFLDPAYIAGFRYLTDGASNLPVGFAVDTQTGSTAAATWVGLTCSACHTNEVRFGQKTMRVEGGPTLGDFQGLFEAFNATLVQTHGDAAKFKRFGDTVLGANASPSARQKLKTELKALVDYQLEWARLNKTGLRYGPGRLDAVGHILNKVAMVAKPVGGTANPPDAPVSYPFLWNTSQQTRIQWSGFIANTPKTFPSGQTLDLGALGRNTGEVVGVFANVKARPTWLRMTVPSSVEVQNLIALEEQLMTLKPPRWPREVMPVDEVLAARGKQVFKEQNCAACHTPLARDDLTTRSRPGTSLPLEEMTPLFSATPGGVIGTDPWMACNLVTAQADTGAFKGKRVAPFSGQTFGAVATNSELLSATVKYILLDKAADILDSTVQIVLGVHPPVQVNQSGALIGMAGGLPPDPYVARLAACKAAGQAYPEVAKILAYKGRPLTGVWATGPFLHNGSVPTMYDLFLPPDLRPKQFWVGSRQFDATKVGFVATPRQDNTFRFDVVDAGGKIIQGNSNLGHDYNNAGLSDADRWALVEYMKVIGE